MGLRKGAETSLLVQEGPCSNHGWIFCGAQLEQRPPLLGCWPGAGAVWQEGPHFLWTDRLLPVPGLKAS